MLFLENVNTKTAVNMFYCRSCARATTSENVVSRSCEQKTAIDKQSALQPVIKNTHTKRSPAR